MKIELYTIYCRNTIEQRMLENKSVANNHSVKNSNNDESFYDFVVVD